MANATKLYDVLWPKSAANPREVELWMRIWGWMFVNTAKEITSGQRNDADAAP